MRHALQSTLSSFLYTVIAYESRVNNESIDGFKYMQSFTDVCTGAVFVYFLKAKSEAIQAKEKFLADVASYGTVKCIRSDNGTEFTNREFQTLLRKKKIRKKPERDS